MAFSKLTQEMENFISLNKQYWQSFELEKEEVQGYTLVESFLKTPIYLLQSGRIAKYLEKEEKYKPLILVNNFFKGATNQTDLYFSFNIKDFIYLKRYLINILSLFRSLLMTIWFYWNNNDGNDLLDLKYKEMNIGDLIYDKIIRTNSSVYTINEIKLYHLKSVFQCYLLLFSYNKIFKKYNINYVIVSHKTYIRYGLLARLAAKKGAQVIFSGPKQIKKYSISTIKEHVLRPDEKKLDEVFKDKEKYLQQVNTYLSQRFKGEINQHDVINAYRGKKEYQLSDLKKELNIQNQLPFVFIMSHAFSDDPHGSCEYLFKDYYDWLLQTLKLIAKIPTVNWIVKPHPSANIYGEEGLVEDLVQKYGSKNVYIPPSDLSTNSIKNIAKATITVGGTAGLEFSCFGIPSVIASKTFYGRYGFTIEPRNKAEYQKQLENIHKVAPLEEDQIQTAKLILAYIKLYNKNEDPLLPETYRLLDGDFWKLYSISMSEINANLKEHDPTDFKYIDRYKIT